MDGRFINNNPFSEQEENDNNQDNVAESPSSTFFNDMMKITNSTSSPRKGFVSLSVSVSLYALLFLV
jgi:hypothetical protein